MQIPVKVHLPADALHPAGAVHRGARAHHHLGGHELPLSVARYLASRGTMHTASRHGTARRERMTVRVRCAGAVPASGPGGAARGSWPVVPAARSALRARPEPPARRARRSPWAPPPRQRRRLPHAAEQPDERLRGGRAGGGRLGVRLGHRGDHLGALDRHTTRGVEADAHPVAADVDQGHDDVVPDQDPLALLAGQYEHGTTVGLPLPGAGRPALSGEVGPRLRAGRARGRACGAPADRARTLATASTCRRPRRAPVQVRVCSRAPGRRRRRARPGRRRSTAARRSADPRGRRRRSRRRRSRAARCARRTRGRRAPRGGRRPGGGCCPRPSRRRTRSRAASGRAPSSRRARRRRRGRRAAGGRRRGCAGAAARRARCGRSGSAAAAWPRRSARATAAADGSGRRRAGTAPRRGRRARQGAVDGAGFGGRAGPRPARSPRLGRREARARAAAARACRRPRSRRARRRSGARRASTRSRGPGWRRPARGRRRRRGRSTSSNGSPAEAPKSWRPRPAAARRARPGWASSNSCEPSRCAAVGQVDGHVDDLAAEQAGDAADDRLLGVDDAGVGTVVSAATARRARSGSACQAEIGSRARTTPTVSMVTSERRHLLVGQHGQAVRLRRDEAAHGGPERGGADEHRATIRGPRPARRRRGASRRPGRAGSGRAGSGCRSRTAAGCSSIACSSCGSIMIDPQRAVVEVRRRRRTGPSAARAASTRPSGSVDTFARSVSAS